MKTDIHPTYYPEAIAKCACGNTFTVGSTMEKIDTEVCGACHPFYTGQARFVDSASRIERFKMKQDQAKPLKVRKQEKKPEEEVGPQTLREMLQALKR